MRSGRVLAVAVAAVLGVVCGAVTSLALPRAAADPLGLGVGLQDLGCSSGRSVVMVGWGREVARLTSAAASNPGAHYLRTDRSCATTWRYVKPGGQHRGDPPYVVYLGPFSTSKACALRMQGAYKGDFVTALTQDTPGMVQCVCHVDLATAPTLERGMTVDATASIWLRQLQEMLIDARRLPAPVTGTYDAPTAAAVRALQTGKGRRATGVVDPGTWQIVSRQLCRSGYTS